MSVGKVLKEISQICRKHYPHLNLFEVIKKHSHKPNFIEKISKKRHKYFLGTLISNQLEH